MTDQLPATPADEAPAPIDAYALLTKPTLDLSDAEVDIVIADLRTRRAKHLVSGKPDKLPAPPKPKAPALTAAAKAEAKKAATADLLGSLELDWKI